jgi:hypothetical protein
LKNELSYQVFCHLRESENSVNARLQTPTHAPLAGPSVRGLTPRLCSDGNVS